MMRARGLTLVEVLAAMAVLVIGVSAVTLMMFTGTKFTRASLERNAAAMIVSEAIPEIERRHLITETMLRTSGIYNAPTEQVGLFIETVNNNQPLGTFTYPDIHDPEYVDLKISENMTHGDAFALKCFETMTPDQIHMSMWPMPSGASGELPKTYGSLLVLRGGDKSPHGTPLRVLYRLERHQDWQPHTIDATGAAIYQIEDPGSAYRGVYVLTLTIYKDSKRDGSTLEQVTDPYVVYLNDKKVR